MASHEVGIRPTARLAVCLSSVIFVHCDQTVRETETADERNTLFLALTIRVWTEVLQTGELKVGVRRTRTPAVVGLMGYGRLMVPN